ncbi:MAG: ergothioneine biosynthesis protein EgtB [Pseudomonadota bacterium]
MSNGTMGVTPSKRFSPVTANPDVRVEPGTLLRRYLSVRQHSLDLIADLTAEDLQIQSMPDVSPGKWHLAHTSWFFETFILREIDSYRVFDPSFEELYNSYYNAVGPQFPRHRRGLISRPDLPRVLAYRHHVDQQIGELLEHGSPSADTLAVIELGLNHEQQHQELMLMDIKHVLFQNPTWPAYKAVPPPASPPARPASWLEVDAGETQIGFDGDGFSFDNELPRHPELLTTHGLADRLVTNAEYLEFVQDGGYRQSALWLSDGWATVQNDHWQAPLYWVQSDDGWQEFTLNGLQPLDLAGPVAHVSFYEADAYASWRGCRLPTEAEWEHSAHKAGQPHGTLVPLPAGPHWPQFTGALWQWTRSAYQPYPGFEAPAGALGEYNGKFMCSQMVLRGSSFATPQGHARTTYRNFFYPHQRWMFSGIRLAKSQ